MNTNLRCRSEFCVALLLGAGLILSPVTTRAAQPSVAPVKAPAARDLQLEVVTAITDRYILPDQRPVSAGTTRTLRISAAPGEFEPASFVVYAGDRDSGELTLSATPLAAVDGEPLPGGELDIRIVKRWYQTSFGDKADKNLRYLTPELLVYDDELVRTEGQDNYVRVGKGEYLKTSDPGMFIAREVVPVEDFRVRDADSLQPLSIAAGSNRQLWVTLHTPADAMPGTYRSVIMIRRAGEVVLTLPVEVELLPIDLLDTPLEVSIYYRARLDRRMPYGSISAEVKSEAQYLAELRNMADHGIKSPTVYQPYGSRLLGRVLELHREAGLDGNRLYHLGVTVVGNNEGRVPASLGNTVRDVIDTAARFDYDDVYFYGRDEAEEDGLIYQFPFWDAVREAGGKIMAAGWQTNATRPGNFDVTGGREDIFACLGTVREEEAARWHAQGRKIYSYQNPTGGYEIPETFRRNYGLLLWQKNFDGAIPYAYQDGEGRIWYDFDSRKNRDLAFTYPTVNGVVDTLQWEGFREGIDDLRYMATLEAALDKAPQAGAGSGRVAAVQAARAWLTDFRSSVLARQDLDAARQAMAAHIMALQGNAPAAAATAGPDSLAPDNSRSSAIMLASATAIDAGDSYRVTVDVSSDHEHSYAIDWQRSLLGWWRFSSEDDGDIADLSSWGHVAELKSDARIAPGYFGNGVELDGEGDLVAMPDIEVPENGTATIEGWFRFDQFAMDMQTNLAVFSGLYQHAANNYFYFARTNEYFMVGNRIERGVWHHLALTWSGDASTATLYVDGHPLRVVVMGSIEEVPAISGLSIGRSNSMLVRLLSSTKGLLRGGVDEIRVWDRVLSEAEVRALYSSSGKSRLQADYALRPDRAPEWRVIGANAADRELADQTRRAGPAP